MTSRKSWSTTFGMSRFRGTNKQLPHNRTEKHSDQFNNHFFIFKLSFDTNRRIGIYYKY